MQGAVYWIGQDGNIWLKNSNGTFNQGPAANASPDSTGYTDPYGTLRLSATQIADPMVKTATATAPSGATLSAPKVFNQAGADNTQGAIDQIPGLLQAALGSEGNQYTNATNGLNAQRADQQDTHDTGIVTNQQNYDSNFMDSIRAGIQGLHGLFSLLRGTGAAGGTAEDSVRNAVGSTTANDIRTGADTQKENAGVLDKSLSDFLTTFDQRRKQADDTHVNNVAAIHRDSSTQLQDLFGKMAGFYGDVGNTAASNDWMNRAGALTPDIAANSKAQTSVYDTSRVPVQSAPVTAFAPPTQPSVLAADPNGQVGSGIFTLTNPNTKRKDQTPALAPAPAGA